MDVLAVSWAEDRSLEVDMCNRTSHVWHTRVLRETYTRWNPMEFPRVLIYLSSQRGLLTR